MRETTDALAKLLDSGARGALATVIRTSGSTPQQPGARMLLLGDGSLVGTVGGGAIENAIIEALRECLRKGKSSVVQYDLGRDLGMCCGGRMEVFVECVESAPRLVLFGAGHVAKPTALSARSIGFRVSVVDDREELNTEERFPECERILLEPKDALLRLQPTANDWFLIVTHDHRLDEEALDTYARGPHHYIGLIGSRRKVFRILQRIQARSALPSLERVYAPVGLQLGAVNPEEIAISIAAELVALRRGQSADHLRAVEHPALQRVLTGGISPEAAAAITEIDP